MKFVSGVNIFYLAFYSYKFFVVFHSASAANATASLLVTIKAEPDSDVHGSTVKVALWISFFSFLI